MPPSLGGTAIVDTPHQLELTSTDAVPTSLGMTVATPSSHTKATPPSLAQKPHPLPLRLK